MTRTTAPDTSPADLAARLRAVPMDLHNTASVIARMQANIALLDAEATPDAQLRARLDAFIGRLTADLNQS